MGADTVIRCWVRDEGGKRNLTGQALTVPVYGYGAAQAITTLSATSPAAGEVTFTVTVADTEQTFAPGLYRFEVKAGDEFIYGGLLEFV